MKNVRHISGMGVAGALMFCAIVCLGWAVPTQAQTDANQYCEIKLSRCPEDYDGDTLKVPLSVVSLSSTIRACAATQTNNIGDPPAIMFIIDHTNSMGTLNDTRGNRYRVARALIDSVYDKVPAAQVGMVVFDAGLFLNSAKVTDPNLVTFKGSPYYNPDTAVEMYMPLMPLNKPALGDGFYTGTSAPNAIDVYRSMLVVGTNSGIRNPSGNGPNSIFGNGRGTNVSIAFEAALEQFAKTGIAKENQYIIFISDGRYEMVAGVGGQAATLPHGGCGGTAGITVDGTSVGDGLYGNSARCPKQRDFMYGQIGGQKIPTTYTVFLNTDADSVMRRNRATLDTMTWAIQDNNYSPTNSSSDIWTADGNQYQGLLTLMMDNIINKMLTQTMPKSLVVTSAGIRDSAGNLVDTFSFNRMLPIDTLTVSPVNMSIIYEVDSAFIVKDPDTGLDDTVRTLTNKKIDYDFYIQRTANPPNNWATSQGLTSKCDYKPTIGLWYGDKEVDVVKENMTNLTVRFTTGDFFDYSKEDVDSIQIFMVLGTTQDTLYTGSLRLDVGAGVFSWDFVRAKVSDDGQIVVGNNRLEHTTQNDSIVIFFRNPRIPLDVIRVAYLYASHDMVFSGKANDLSAVIIGPATVRAGDTLNIYALLVDGKDEVDQAMLESGTVRWTFPAQDGATLTPDGSHAVFLGTKTGEYKVTATFESNGMSITKELTIKVTPGDAVYLEVVFKDPSANPPPEHVADTDKLKNNKKLEIPKGVDDTTLYVVARDEYGNLIGPTEGTWDKDGGTSICLAGGTSCNTGPTSSSVLVRRDPGEKSFDTGIRIVVSKGRLSDTVDVTVEGDPSASIGPNPFVPGVDSPREIYERISPEFTKYYKEILEAGAVGGGGTRGGDKGILIAGTPSYGVKTEGNGDPKATVVIYDAVGNIVFRSKPKDVTLVKDNNTFGFIWNGKNNKGRTVGPGTYLVRMSVELENGSKFVDSKKIGVTKQTK